MTHVYIATNRLITSEEIDKKFEKQIKWWERKEMIEKIKEKIKSIFAWNK